MKEHVPLDTEEDMSVFHPVFNFEQPVMCFITTGSCNTLCFSELTIFLARLSFTSSSRCCYWEAEKDRGRRFA